MPPGTSPLYLPRIQALRGIAAALVLAHHLLRDRPLVPTGYETGMLGLGGVMIFFVISGIVLPHTQSAKTPLRFLIDRAIRILPLYWIMTLARWMLLERAALAQGLPPSTETLLPSLLLWPHYHPLHAGEVWPLLIPGWTLTFEALFFVVFAITLLPDRAFRWLAAILALAAAGLLGLTDPAWRETLLSPLPLLFFAGWAGLRCGPLPAPSLALWAGFGALIWASLAAQPLLMGLAAAVTTLGALTLDRRSTDGVPAPLLWLGDISYSLYLSHAVILGSLLAFIASLPLPGADLPRILMVLAIAVPACLLTGWITHRLIERPLLSLMRTPLARPTKGVLRT